MTTNPWTTPFRTDADRPPDTDAAHVEPAPIGSRPPREADVTSEAPHLAESDDRNLSVDERGAWWWLGAHGGAGERTLLALTGTGQPAHHTWPGHDHTRGDDVAVVLVARTHAPGLRAAQAALADWAAGTVAADVLGLALIADQPGRLPRPLRHLTELVAGGAPRTWRLPWIPELRLGDPLNELTVPGAYTELAHQLRAATRDAAATPRGNRRPIAPRGAPQIRAAL